MRTKLTFIAVIAACVLLCIGYSCSGKSSEQSAKEETQNTPIYLKYDSSGKPIYSISEELVPDSIWREKLGKALVTIYLGKIPGSGDEKAFREAGPMGIKVLIEASKVIENDNGTAASVLRNLGKEGCIAMINYLKSSINNSEGLNLYFIEELGNCGYENSIEVLSLVLNYQKGLPEEKVASAVALAKLGDYRGLDVLKKMRAGKNDQSWQQLIDENINTIEQLRLKRKR